MPLATPIVPGSLNDALASRRGKINAPMNAPNFPRPAEIPCAVVRTVTGKISAG